MDAREQLKRYLEQRRDMGETELVLDGLTVDEALRAYTAGGAYASFREHDAGTIAPGMLADLTVIDRDLRAIAPAEIRDARVVRTIVGGKTVYLRR